MWGQLDRIRELERILNAMIAAIERDRDWQAGSQWWHTDRDTLLKKAKAAVGAV